MRWLFLLLLVASSLNALEPEPNLAPWFGELFEFRLNGSYTYQHYKKLDSPAGSFVSKANNSFVAASLALSPWPNWDTEIEFLLAKTAKNPFCFEAFRLTSRYLWLDDIAGDFISLTTGFTLTVPTTRFLEDLSTPFHGNANVALHAALGKEFLDRICWSWSFRLWALGGLGVANRGSPFAFAKVAFDKNLRDKEQFGTYLDFQWGLGQSNLVSAISFSGYQNINYQATDLALFYQKLFCNLATLSIDYAYRLAARNFPKHVHTLTLGCHLTFGL